MILVTRFLILVLIISFVACGNKMPLRMPDGSLDKYSSHERN